MELKKNLLKPLLNFLSIIFFILFLLGITQKYTNILLKKKIDLELHDVEKKDGFGLYKSIPKQFRNINTEENSYILYNGKKLRKKNYKSKKVKNAGQGRYVFSKSYILYSFPEIINDDLKTTSKLNSDVGKLEAVLPYPVSWSLLIIFLVGLLCSLILRCLFVSNSEEKIIKVQKDNNSLLNKLLEFIHSKNGYFLILAIIFSFSLFVKFRAHTNDPTPTKDYFLVNGMSYSDAIGWQQLAKNLMSGDGIIGNFDGNRPFYSVFLGAINYIYDFKGFEVFLINVLIISLAIICIFCLLSYCENMLLGFLISCAIIFSSYHFEFMHLALSEPLSIGLMIIASCIFFISLTQKSKIGLLISGGLFGFSNLTQTLSLLQLPFLCLLIFLYNFKFNKKQLLLFQNYLRVGILGIFFTVGVSMVFIPWLIRQKTIHGVPALSFSGMEVLYGTTTEQNKFHAEIFHESLDAGIHFDKGKRYKFFSEKFKEAVRKKPKTYFNTVLTSIKKYCEQSFKKYKFLSFFYFIYSIYLFITLLRILLAYLEIKQKYLIEPNYIKNRSIIIINTIVVGSVLISLLFFVKYFINLWGFMIIFLLSLGLFIIQKNIANKIKTEEESYAVKTNIRKKILLIGLLAVLFFPIAFLCGLMGKFPADRFVGYTNWIVITIFCIFGGEVLKIISSIIFSNIKVLENSFSDNVNFLNQHSIKNNSAKSKINKYISLKFYTLPINYLSYFIFIFCTLSGLLIIIINFHTYSNFISDKNKENKNTAQESFYLKSIKKVDNLLNKLKVEKKSINNNNIHSLSADQKEMVKNHFLNNNKAIKTYKNFSDLKLKIDVFHISNFYCFINGGERTGHWARIFSKRNTNRFTAYLRSGINHKYNTNGLIVTHFHKNNLDFFKSEKTLNKSFVLVAIENYMYDPPLWHDKMIYEGVAIYEYDHINDIIDLDSGEFFEYYLLNNEVPKY